MVVSAGINPRRIQRIVFRHDLELGETHHALVSHLKDVAEQAVQAELARLETLSKTEIEDVCKAADWRYGRAERQSGSGEQAYGYANDER